MATVHFADKAVRVELQRWERLFAGGRARFVIPFDAIEIAERVDRPTKFAATPGGRAGMYITGVVKVGRWGIGTGRRIFVSARRRVPALHLVVTKEFADQFGYGELLISTPWDKVESHLSSFNL